MVMAIDAQLVRLDRAVAHPVERFVQATDPALSVTTTIDALTPLGSAGDPTGADAEKGRMFLQKTVAIIADKFEAALKTFSA